MGSMKRAMLRREQKEREKKEKNRERRLSAERLVGMGCDRELAESIIRGMEDQIRREIVERQQELATKVQAEMDRRMLAMTKAVSETAGILERQVCCTNLVLFLRAVELTFGHLKTVRNGYDRLLRNYGVAVDEMAVNGARNVCEGFKERNGIDYVFEEFDIDGFYEELKAADIVASELKKIAAEEGKI